MISTEALTEFKAIWKKNYGEDISDERALDKAMRLLTLTRIVCRFVAKEAVDKDEEDGLDAEEAVELKDDL